MSIPWTPAELAILREAYPTGGLRAVMAQIDRTEGSIRSMARDLGIRSLAPQSAPARDAYMPSPEEFDEALARVKADHLAEKRRQGEGEPSESVRMMRVRGVTFVRRNGPHEQ